MAYASTSHSDLEQIIALALQESDSTKMAAAAMVKTGLTNDWTGSQKTYVFVIDTSTGAHVGKGVKFIHGGHGGTNDFYD